MTTIRNEPFETVDNTDTADAPRYTHHIENPYTLDVTRRAWAEGYQAARSDSDNGVEESEQATNPYTSGDTSTAWTNGYRDWDYTPGHFDPMNPLTAADDESLVALNNMAEFSKQTLFRTELTIVQKPDDLYAREVWLVWAQTYTSHNVRLSWKENKVQDRGIRLEWRDAQSLVLQNVHNTTLLGEGRIELPCPSYEFEAGVGELTISKGTFKKTGSKDDWQQVIDEMQRQLDEVPNGLNVEDVYIGVDVRVSGTVSIQMPASSLCNTDGYGKYEGTKDELYDEIVSSLDYNDHSYEVREYIAEAGVDWEIDEYEASDLDYDLESVEEL